MLGFKRVIAASIVLALIVAGLGGFLVFTQLSSVAQSRTWVLRSRAVLEETEVLLSSVQDAESGEHSYLLTQDPRDMASAGHALDKVDREQAALAGMVNDNAAQVARVTALNQVVDRRQLTARAVVALTSAGKIAEAQALVKSGQGRAEMADIRARLATIRGEEDKLLAARRALALRQQDLSLFIGLAVSFLALLALVAGVVLLARANRRLIVAMEQARIAEEERRANDALARAIFANSPDYLIVLGVEPDDRFVLADINPAFERALNVSAARVRGRSIADLLPVIGPRLVSHYRRVVAGGKPVTTRDDVPRSPSGPRIWESTLAPVANPEGVIDRIIGSIRDITERVQAEERLRESQRMEAVGQLTGGVAHDFNNLLQVIRGNLDLLQSAVAGNERATQRLKNAVHGAERAAQLTRQLLAFARRQPLAPQVINLSRLVSDMAELLRRTLGESVEVETVVAGGLWNTMADPAQVESALLNLALNARDAMPDGGRLTIEITNAVLDEAYAREARDVAAGQYVLLAVSDTGQGMDEETKARVFEPFFTTKVDGKGTGLGLSMVYGFAKQSNGHIQIYSEVGDGTTVKIYLPRSHHAAQSAAPQLAEAPADAGGRVILVVEDEEAVRAAAIATLDELGYRCLEASDSESALGLVETHNEIELVFTDVVMPGRIKTRDFAQRMRELRPDVPVLFTSGYTENAIVHHGRLDDGVNLISKPYGQEDLARRLAQLLSQPAGAA